MKLGDYLERKHISKATFAREIGVSDETVRRYLTGERRPEWAIIARIIDATDGKVTANDFIEAAA